MSILLQVEDLSRTFCTRGNDCKVFANLNLTLQAGEILVIRGRSGVGKSTLLGLLSGLDRPTGGRILFQNRDLTKLSLSELSELRAVSIGMIFQSFNLISTWSALENVEAVLMHRGIRPAERHERASKMLAELGLAERLHNLPSELSVGQQQRVAVARTLVNEPSLILADEPTGDVDMETANEILRMLLPRVRNSGAGMIVATHGLFPEEHATRVMLLKDGQLHEQTGGSSV